MSTDLYPLSMHSQLGSNIIYDVMGSEDVDEYGDSMFYGYRHTLDIRFLRSIVSNTLPIDEQHLVYAIIEDIFYTYNLIYDNEYTWSVEEIKEEIEYSEQFTKKPLVYSKQFFPVVKKLFYDKLKTSILIVHWLNDNTVVVTNTW